MYLSEHKSLRLLTLCGLYVAQGIPWGFVTVTFAAWLAQPQQGITTEQLGPILAVATLPWSFKFLWGPLMDRFTIRSIGRRRPWIILAQSMAILILGSMIFVEDLAGLVWTTSDDESTFSKTVFALVPGPLAALILLANLFISLQDVAVDALAVDLLEERERGIANGLMYGSSYLGTAVGGAGLGFIVSQFGIQAGLFGQAVLLFSIMLLPILFRERPAEAEYETSRSPADEPKQSVSAEHIDFGETPFEPPHSAESGAGTTSDELRLPSAVSNRATDSVFANLLRAFSLRATLLGVVVALGAKIGIGVLTAVLVDYLMKDGGWTQEQYTAVTGGWAVMIGLAGSAVGGFLADSWGPKRLILASSAVLGLLWISAGSMSETLSSRTFMTGLLLGQELLLSVMTVSLFSLFMCISWPKVAATQFTAYMALMNLSTTVGSYLAGQLSLSLSVAQILVAAGALQVIAAIPVLLIDPRQTRRILGNAD